LAKDNWVPRPQLRLQAQQLWHPLLQLILVRRSERLFVQQRTPLRIFCVLLYLERGSLVVRGLRWKLRSPGQRDQPLNLKIPRLGLLSTGGIRVVAVNTANTDQSRSTLNEWRSNHVIIEIEFESKAAADTPPRLTTRQVTRFQAFQNGPCAAVV